ncbi:MAG: c-type cytochrome [Candidatus Binataceae bacterium]
MLRTHVAFVTAAGAVAAMAGLAILPFTLRAQPATSQHPVPASKHGNVVVMLCDGKTSLEVEGLKPGQRMSHEQATSVTRKLMDTWQREHPGERWEMAQAQSPAPANPPSESSAQPPAAPAKAPAQAQQQGDTYASFHERDFKVWQAETQKFVEEGKRVFHSDKLLGSTIGVSCDMCHPDASNTHPETYPKYQVQLQRVALLRDMIDWCIENPVKGKTMTPNDERLRALEAYIIAQRKGVPLDYGKH